MQTELSTARSDNMALDEARLSLEARIAELQEALAELAAARDAAEAASRATLVESQAQVILFTLFRFASSRFLFRRIVC